MTIAYFDCFSGAGGDMIVAALIDAGADPARLREALDGLNLSGYELAIDKINKQGFAATRFHVQLDENAARPHRHLADIVKILDESVLPAPCKQKARNIFTRLAEAEAAVHGTSIEKVHFHEVGAVDAILDIVGTVVALDLLRVDQIHCSPVPVGSGTVMSEHGTLPVPAPATANLLRGVPIAACDEPGELLTPTAAAVLTTLAARFGPMPAMRMASAGYGAGTRQGQHRPNVLRVMIGEASEDAGTDSVTVLETNIDDATPQMIGHCVQRLLDAGVLDVYTVPIQMKKQRPGVLLSVLCAHPAVPEIERIIFAETTTLGIRRRVEARTTLARRIETVETAFGPIRVKLADVGHGPTVAPEYEDCRSAAAAHGVGLREVMAAAQQAWQRPRQQ